MPPTLTVGSENPSKLAAVRRAADRLCAGWEVRPLAVASGVAKQPLGEAVVRRGARQRARLARRGGGWGVGMENGLRRGGGLWFAIGWCTVCGPDGVLGEASSPAWRLPTTWAAALEAALAAGGTQGDAMAALLGGTPRDWALRGSVAALGAGGVDRRDLWEVPLTLALAAALWEAGLSGPRV